MHKLSVQIQLHAIRRSSKADVRTNKMKSVVILLGLMLALGDAATTTSWNDTFPDWPTTVRPNACNSEPYNWKSMEQMFYYLSDVVVYGEVEYGDMYGYAVKVFCVLKNKGNWGPIPQNITVMADTSGCGGGFTLYPGKQYLLGLVHKYMDIFDLVSNTMYQRAIYPYSYDQYERAVAVCGLDMPMIPSGFDFSSPGCPRHDYRYCFQPMTASGAIPRMAPIALLLIMAYWFF